MGTEERAAEPTAAGEITARRALEEIVLGAVLSPPCVVSFSGGRDSSAILALAAHVARREGLQPPIVSTLRFTGAPLTEEREWQELVMRHLALDDWVVREITDELDCVGPIAQPILRRHGLLWPVNAHFMALHSALARGGTVLTGAGGDQLLTPSRYVRHDLLLAGRALPRLTDLPRLGHAAAPKLLRRAWVSRRDTEADQAPWLRERARVALRRKRHEEAASEPFRAWRRTAWTWRSRALQVGIESLSLVSGDDGATAVHPFLEPAFVSALSGELRRRGGYRDRTEAMHELFGDLLPVEVRSRATKASFDEIFWNRHTRRFLDAFDGTGIDDELVYAEALLRHWLAPRSGRAREMVPLQASWLAADRPRRSDGPEPLEQHGAGLAD